MKRMLTQRSQTQRRTIRLQSLKEEKQAQRMCAVGSQVNGGSCTGGVWKGHKGLLGAS